MMKIVQRHKMILLLTKVNHTWEMLILKMGKNLLIRMTLKQSLLLQYQVAFCEFTDLGFFNVKVNFLRSISMFLLEYMLFGSNIADFLNGALVSWSNSWFLMCFPFNYMLYGSKITMLSPISYKLVAVITNHIFFMQFILVLN